MPDEPVALPKANRTGLVLFLLYFLAYAGFIGIAALKVSLLRTPVLGGVNLAVVYGMALIVGALALAIVYLFAPVDESEGRP